MFHWQHRLAVIGAALTLQTSICGAQPSIGSAAAVRNQVDGILNSETRNLASGSSVHSNELIRSADAALAELVFWDKTRLSVGPKSEVRLDKFVYNPNRGSGAVVIDTSRGVYRFITGVQDPRSYEIKTPYATLGVRGTTLEINLEGVEAGATPLPDRPECRNYIKVKLVKGAFIATTTSGRTIMINDPNTVLTVCSDGNTQTTKMAGTILPFTPIQFAEAPPPAGPSGGTPGAPSGGATGPAPSGPPSSTVTTVSPGLGLGPEVLAGLAGVIGIIALTAGAESNASPPVISATAH
jgi:hypothetical protein